MLYKVLPLILTNCIAIVFIAIIFVSHNVPRRVRISLIATILSLLLWQDAIYFADNTALNPTLVNTAVFIWPTTAIISCFAFIRNLHKVQSKSVVRSRLTGLIIGTTLLQFVPILTLSIFTSAESTPQGFAFERGVGYYVYIFALLASILILVTEVILRILRSSIGSRERKAMKIVMMTIVMAAAYGVGANVLVPLFTDRQSLIGLGVLVIDIFTIGLWFSIAKGRLIDIRFYAVRTVVYALSLLAMAIIYFGLAYVASVLFFQDSISSAVSISPTNVALALVLALIFQPIKQFFDRITDSIFYRDRYSTDDLIADVGAVVTSTVDLKQLLETTAETIARTIKASGASFVVYREDKSPLQIGTKGHVYLTTGEIDDLRNYIDEKGSTIINISEQTEKAARRPAIITVLSRRRVALVVPLVERQGSIGFLLIDEQKGSGYVKHDVRALQTLTDELVVAVQNAISLQEVRDINTHLEQRINAATRELRLSNNQLKALDETKDEFISMASHQLRTPLTSIKGYISMVLDGDVGEINPTQRKLLSEAFASSERMVHLIGDFLNVSRLQTGKFIIDQKPTNLTQVVAEEVESIESLVTSHNMTLVYKAPKNIPIMEIDEDKIRQVIMNFIDNAVYYSRPGSTIVVKLARRGESVELEVHDQGIGVPAEAQKRLFGKFFRAGNARRQRPDGTGIGLFLAKKVVLAQGGEMIFESTEGKGSVFGFRLPIHPKTPRHRDGE